METNQLILKRSGIVITLRCTLKCKLCGGYAPYYKTPPHYSYDYIADTIDNYFGVIDKVGDFSITGGEPLLHKDLGRILNKTMEYSSQIGRILILTNGTMLFSDEVLEILQNHKDKLHVTISNYGFLSTRADELENKLKILDISHRVIKYSGENLFCDGWVDYGDHSRKHFTQKETDIKGKKCAIRSRDVSIILNGELHSCGRSFRRMELGIIPKNKNEYVDLLDSNTTINEKKDIISLMFRSDSTTSCAYCNGLCEDSERFPPAEQLMEEK
ncbi:radical SAM protein [Acetobacterium wieringae]|uniref:radical SAM protein n=1 Tax=Acetobacterium wieringae TaxID=52694 RepID=UPI0020335B2A|nr:radical SAM protein [Acetobacterium wieringae]URN85411.1 radical SAM protein [Acetobacterium wieringae]